MSLTREQFFKNSAWTFAELTLYPVLVIIATPVFIARLGIEQYGLWMLVSTITLGINVLNIGVGDTTIRLISQYRAEDRPDKIKNVFRHNFSLALFLCFIALIAGALFYTFDFISLFYKTTDYTFASSILFMACLSAGVKFVEISVLSVFKAFERFDLNSKLTLLSKNSVVIMSLLMVMMGKGLITVFLITIGINICNIVLQLLVLNSFNKNIISWPAFVFFKKTTENVNYNFWYWLQSSIALLGFLTDKLAVAWFTDMQTLGYYSIASMIATNIHNFFLSFGAFIFPRVSYKLANKRDLAPLYFVSRSLIALPGWVIISLLIFGGDFIFKLWLGETTFLNSIYFIKLYLVFEAGMLLIVVPFYFINGTRQIKLNSLFEGVIRTSHFCSMLLGYYLIGVNGIIYGLILSTFLNIPFQYYFFHKKVIKTVNSFQFLMVILPVMFLLAITISGNLIFQVSLFLALVICIKLVYVDSAKQYSKDILFFRKVAG